ncbi:MAG: carboxypeptidase-like regulatory domain-containing protein [Capsulimonadaceae bacterium]|nr:carboxypeptidase-like regulatory domain-containing protein [Capsulimonadaceae bacterium]
MKTILTPYFRLRFERVAVLLALCSLALLAGCGGGGGGGGGSTNVVTVTGTVLDELTAKPLAGRTVTLKGTAQSGTTDAKGVFTIANVTTGSYTLVVTDSLGDTDGSVAVAVAGGNGGTDSLGSISVDTSSAPPPPPLVRTGS